MINFTNDEITTRELQWKKLTSYEWENQSWVLDTNLWIQECSEWKSVQGIVRFCYDIFSFAIY